MCEPSEPAIGSSGEDPQQVEEPLPPMPSLPLPPPPCHQKLKQKAPPEGVQCLSHIPVPLDYVQCLTQGEGTIDRRISNLKWMHPNMQEQLSLPDQSFHTALDNTTAAGIKYAYQADFDNIIMAAIQDAQGDPKSLNEAQLRLDWPSWEKAMGSEINMLQCAGTWETMPHPAGKNIVGCKWVYRIKRKADGSIDKYKVRLVAHGFTQIYGVDYLNTFSPVAKLASICTILAIAAQLD
jgi:hypothetical protein